MKLPLGLVASILLTSVRANHWPYHEIVGVGQSPEQLLHVAPVYGVAPVVSSLPAEPPKETIVVGPITGTTFVEGSSSGPVSVVSAGTPEDVPETGLPTIEKGIGAPVVPESAVLIKGATTGTVTLVAASPGKIGAVASADEEESSNASTNTTVIEETEGVASDNAVIGPSVGPIVIAGPTAPPLPAAFTSTVEPVTVTNDTNSDDVDSSAETVAPISIDDETDATNSTRIEASSSSSISSAPAGSTGTVATAKVNLIIPAIAETPLSNAVVSATTASSAIASDPTGIVSSGSLPLLLKANPP